MSTNIKAYSNTAVTAAAALLQGDNAITFSVLANILHGTCTMTVTDTESFILCYSTAPYPVWVWCRDDGNDANYPASNACYKKIGYREVAALCCVGKK